MDTLDRLKTLGIIPVDYGVLQSLFSDYKYPNNKILNLENDGKLIRLKKGLYIVSPDVSGHLLSTELIANHIYGPSYLSMETALRFYGLIPEKVIVTRSMTLKRSKSFKNSLGVFEYIGTKEDYYSIGIIQESDENGITFQIATKEKALCDLIAGTPNLKLQSTKALREYLENDIRFDMSALSDMGPSIIRECAETGKKKSILKLLLEIIEQ